MLTVERFASFTPAPQRTLNHQRFKILGPHSMLRPIPCAEPILTATLLLSGQKIWQAGFGGAISAVPQHPAALQPSS
ncbi:hypothetical protein Pla111_11310 [Botrimarina hoheduenensis]|uniref:Uncharacterized protein n=1 Tax=Botrimarina hoheduenensis TaxID=2528000 RepID=A0A5C5WAI0_9BACT|nr:hypothetical protein Pla111_11310 [Botrimarina hoheduenensis]